MGQSAEKHCTSYGQIDSWLKPYPTLESWYHFYSDRQQCDMSAEEFFKTLASSEPLSIKLNETRVSFEQFYVPIYSVLAVTDWKKIGDDDSQKIQSDLSSIDHSLKTAMGRMSDLDRDYFRSMVLFDLSSDFVQNSAFHLSLS